MYYGKKAHLVQTHSTNHVGGWEHVYSSFTYAGLPLQMSHIHTGAERRTIKEEYSYKYDHTGRLTEINYGINGRPKVALSSIEYDDNGRLFSQTLPCGEVISHDYNLRSWPTSISSGKFTQKLAYNVSNGNLFPMKGTYNGNISSMSWQVGGDVRKGYFFRYNNQNMLTEAQYREGDSFADAEDHYSEHLEYDLMGNVEGLKRYGLLDDGSYGLVDDLFYMRYGNQLEWVSDEIRGPYCAGTFHFVDGADESLEYAYDANGNMILDMNKGIVSISYDVNNCPIQITFEDGRYIVYVYDAEGNKLSVSYNLTAMTSAQPQMAAMEAQDVVSANQEMGITTRNYCGNIVYDKGLVTVLNDVGYAECDENGDVSCYYYLNDYYATGGLMGSSTEGECQRYKYNGKELDRTHGLDWYDYGARNYDAALVVWNGVDELSEKFYPVTSYGYCFNNFLNAFDKDGKDVVVLLAPRGAGGAGHMAILIQNPDGRWALWSKNGTPDNMHAYGKEGGKNTKYHNNRGGSLDGNESSYQTIEDFFNSKKDNPKKDGMPEYTEGYKMSTTKEQDEKARTAIEEELNKDYDVLSSNCAQAVQAALKAAGLNPGKGILPKKQVYPSITKNNPGRFQMFYNMSKRKYYKYKK